MTTFPITLRPRPADGQLKLKWLPAASNVVTFPKKGAQKKAPRKCGAFAFYYLRSPKLGPVGVNVSRLANGWVLESAKAVAIVVSFMVVLLVV
jgi:hypothetical protein